MNASERRDIARVLALVQSGDRSSAISALRALHSPPARPLIAGSQLVLGFITSETFHCDRLDATFRIGECLQRRSAKWPSGRRKGRHKSPQCHGCPIGQEFAFALPGVILRAPSQPPEVLPQSQRIAKRARDLASIGWDEGVGLDPLSEAAMLSRDDVNDWRT